MNHLTEDVRAELAPVAIFGFNRPLHLSDCLRSLEANLEAMDTDVYVFLDGPRSQVDTETVEATRKVARESYKFRSLTITEQDTNLG